MMRFFPTLQAPLAQFAVAREPEVVVEFEPEPDEPELPTTNATNMCGNHSNALVLGMELLTKSWIHVDSPETCEGPYQSSQQAASDEESVQSLGSEQSMLCADDDDDAHSKSSVDKNQASGLTCATEGATLFDSLSSLSVGPSPGEILIIEATETPSYTLTPERISSRLRSKVSSCWLSRLDSANAQDPESCAAKVGTTETRVSGTATPHRNNQAKVRTIKETHASKVRSSKLPPAVLESDANLSTPFIRGLPLCKQQLPTPTHNTQGSNRKAPQSKTNAYQPKTEPLSCDDDPVLLPANTSPPTSISSPTIDKPQRRPFACDDPVVPPPIIAVQPSLTNTSVQIAEAPSLPRDLCSKQQQQEGNEAWSFRSTKTPNAPLLPTNLCRPDQYQRPTPPPNTSLKEVCASRRRGEPLQQQTCPSTSRAEGKEAINCSRQTRNAAQRSGRVPPCQRRRRRNHDNSATTGSSGGNRQRLLGEHDVASSGSGARSSNFSRRSATATRKSSSCNSLPNRQIVKRKMSGGSCCNKSFKSLSLQRTTGSKSLKPARKTTRFPTNESRRPRLHGGSKRTWKCVRSFSGDPRCSPSRYNSSGSQNSKKVPVSFNIFGNEVVGIDFILSQLDELAKNEDIVHLELEDFFLTKRALAIPLRLKEVLEGEIRPWEGVHFVDDLFDGFAYDDFCCNRNRFLHALGGVCEQHLIPVTHCLRVHLHEEEHGHSPEQEKCMIQLLEKFQDDRAVTAVNMSTTFASLKLIRALTALLLCDDRQWDHSMTLRLAQAAKPSTATHAAMKKLKQVSNSKGVIVFH